MSCTTHKGGKQEAKEVQMHTHTQRERESYLAMRRRLRPSAVSAPASAGAIAATGMGAADPLKPDATALALVCLAGGSLSFT